MIYLDNNATTRPLDAVIDAVAECERTCYFNASTSVADLTGANKPRLNAARAMAKLLGASDPKEFSFTSGATESNNWIFDVSSRSDGGGEILISAIEHPSVRESAWACRERGYKVTEIPVDSRGVLRMDVLAQLISDDTVLVSVMAANNETGVIQPIEEIGQVIGRKKDRPLFHTDATQAVGRIPIDLRKRWAGVDLLSFSAHKFHGPKGVGGLFIRDGNILPPFLVGGGQEDGLRSGTTNTPGLAGLAIAAAHVDFNEATKIAALRDRFEEEIQVFDPKVIFHGRGTNRLPNTSAFSIPGISGEDLVQELALAGILAATGSACSSGSVDASHTLTAMGVAYDVAKSMLRISLSRFNSADDLRRLTERLHEMIEVAQGS